MIVPKSAMGEEGHMRLGLQQRKKMCSVLRGHTAQRVASTWRQNSVPCKDTVGVGTVPRWVPRGRSRGSLLGQWGHPSGLGFWLLLEPEHLFFSCRASCRLN